MKIDINQVAEILKKNQLDPKLLRQCIEEMVALNQAGDGDHRPPSLKKQYAILVSDPEGILATIRQDFAGWVLQIPETESVATVAERIHRAAYDYNTTRKGRIYPARTIADAIENIPAKHFKEQGLKVCTKTPVLVLRADRGIPRQAPE